MEYRSLKLNLLIISFLYVHSVSSQYLYKWYKGSSKDTSISSLSIYSGLNHGLKNAHIYKNLNYLYIRNDFPGNRAIKLPSNLLELKNLYFISMGKCKNESILFDIKSLRGLNLKQDTINKDIFKLDNLVQLGLRFKYGDLNCIIQKENHKLRFLHLNVPNGCHLDSCFLLFKNLERISLNINLLTLNNAVILSQMDSLKQINIIGYDFRNNCMDIKALQLLMNIEVRFSGCIITNEQKDLISKLSINKDIWRKIDGGWKT
jgi:hypothetical protein